MGDESSNPVIEPVEKEEVSTQAEETAPKPDIIDQSSQQSEVKERKHPLEPGGDRFNQVWARAKKAEDETRHLREEMQREREERIRLEERIRAKEEQSQQKEMSWDELEKGIEEGRWSRSQAQEYKEKMTEQRLAKRLSQEREKQGQDSRYLAELDQYKAIVPDVMTYGSENRQKYERELQYMVRSLGMPDNYATQVAAARAAFGDVSTAKTRFEAEKKVIKKEPFEETHMPPADRKQSKDFASTLTPEQRKHYEKMLDKGMYKDWKEVEAEFNYVPKSINQRR